MAFLSEHHIARVLRMRRIEDDQIAIELLSVNVVGGRGGSTV